MSLGELKVQFYQTALTEMNRISDGAPSTSEQVPWIVHKK